MLRTSQKQFPFAQIGHSVRIQAPDVDCGRTDVGIEDSNFYKLGNKNDTPSSFTHSINEFSARREAPATNSRSGGQGTQLLRKEELHN